jgi:hypothetical protein
MPANNLMFEGVSVDEIFSQVTKAGVDSSTAGVIAATWVLDNLRKTRRVFNYREPFPAADPDCALAPWLRNFAHADWTDGEDVVQAGQTIGGDEGFNSRFHKIESDLDRLGADIAKVSACLAEMRGSLRKLLDEIRAEINLINADIGETRTGPLTPLTPNFNFLDTAATFKGTSLVLGKKVNIWETKTGMLMLPAVDPVDPSVLGGALSNVGDVTTFVNDDPRVKNTFPGGFKLTEFLDKFGDEKLPNGRPVRDAVKVLPPDATFRDAAHLVDELSTWQAAVVRAREGANVAVTNSLGVDTSTAIADVPIDRLNDVPVGVRAALAAEGVTSVGALANLTPERVSEITRNAGVAVTAGQAAGFAVNARTLVRMGR